MAVHVPLISRGAGQRLVPHASVSNILAPKDGLAHHNSTQDMIPELTTHEGTGLQPWRNEKGDGVLL